MTRKTDPKILILDNDAILRHNLMKYFLSCFYMVVQAENIQVGLNLFQSESPELILISLDLPKTDVQYFFEKIGEESPETPIISITNQKNVKDALDSLRIGAWDYITKPINDYDILKNIVDKVMERGVKLQETLTYQKTLKEEVVLRTADLEQQNISLKKAEESLKNEIIFRQQIDFELRENQEILAHAQRIAHLGKWVWDINEDKLDWSDELYAIYKRPKELGVSIQSWIESIHPEDRNRNEIAINDALSEKTSYNINHRIICHDGEERVIHVEAELFNKNEHRPCRMIGVVQDITKQKAYEAELKKAKEMAESVSRSKSNFLKTMSHELRTPMHGVLGMAELTLLTELDEKQTQYVETIYNASQAMTRILNDILDITKIEANTLELEPTYFNLKRTIESIIHLFSGSANTNNIELKCDIQESIPDLLAGDPNRLNQVLSNLLGNALKFTEKGSVSLNVSLLEKKGDSVFIQFEVIDTGIGIAEENLSYIFQKFTQEDSSSTRKYGGMGMGLSIVKSLVDLMDGQISILSEVDKGTTFTFSIPMGLNKPSIKKVTLPIKSEKIEVNKTRTISDASILIVEDDKVNQKVLEGMLKKLGCSVDILPNGKAALTIIPDFCYDAILMDCLMPVMNGFETTEHIRKMEAEGILPHRTPIIAITANAMQGDKKKCIDSGMDDYLSKPVTLASLEKILNKYICQ